MDEVTSELNMPHFQSEFNFSKDLYSLGSMSTNRHLRRKLFENLPEVKHFED